MKRLHRFLSLILTLCMVVVMLPPLPGARAVEVIQRYELDTDGIDTDGVYLIVSANMGNANALRRNSTSIANQAVIVQTDADGVRYIEIGFSNEENCRFAFSGTASGRVTNGDYRLNMNRSTPNFSTSATNTLTFTNNGNGQYRITYAVSSWFGSTYYLRYNNGWGRSTTSSNVYLFKLADYVVSHEVSYNGNGHTQGTLPANGADLGVGDTYTIEAPADLRKDVGDDSWLFQCWNTAADGSGTEYHPGDTITVNGDMTLYAQWYPVVKYAVTMITYLNGVPTDVDEISGTEKNFYVQLEGGDGTYIPLKKTAEGTYTKKVEQNGTYVVYSKEGDGDYEAVHGHKVMIYNQDGSTECMHYSVTHDLNGGSWPEYFDYDNHPHHSGEAHYAPTAIPELEGNRFLGWQDQDGNLYQPGYLVTASMDKPLVLTAQWEKTVDVTVNVTIDHNSVISGGADHSDAKDTVSLQVMHTDAEGFNHPVGLITLDKDAHGEYTYTYDAEKNITTYTMGEGLATLSGLQPGAYTVSVTKSHYEAVVTSETDADGNITMSVVLTYVPTYFDMDFDVVVDAWESIPQHLRPAAVNIKLLLWSYNEAGELSWHILSQQEGEKPPISVAIDPATGRGTGFYPVWKYWTTDDGSTQPYYYRVAVTSYLMADGTLVPASSANTIHYTGGVYTAAVTIQPGGKVPDYPNGTDTVLQGTHYDDTMQQQDSVPTVNVQVKPFTVTFDAGNGTVNGQQTVGLTNQYLYPDLNQYAAVPNSADRVFICWLDENGEPAVNKAGQVLSGDVTYTARYNENITLTGEVTVHATYEQNGEEVFVNDIDRVAVVQVVLQKKVGDVFNDVASYPVAITYEAGADMGYGSYAFAGLPNDGTQYRVHALVLNYTAGYDNNEDGTFAEAEAEAQVDVLRAEAEVDVNLDFAPATYQQAVKVDSSQIHEDLRPTDALVQILYRDLGDIHPYKVIAHHAVAPGGIRVPMNGATGLGFDDVWCWHTDGTLYEYQAQVSKLYGNNVVGAYTQEGTPYTANVPYTVKYGPANNYIRDTANTGAMLQVTLVPKQYPVVLDLNLGDDAGTPVYGLEHFAMDDGQDGDYFAYMHTWSFADHFIASPYREGYVFKGWTSSNDADVYVTDTGTVHVGSTLAQSVTLTAQWEKLEGTDYTIRYLELNTDQVLRGAKVVRGALAGSSVKAVDEALETTGYVYAGAAFGGVYYDKSENPALTVTNDPLKNLMIIYYLPDGSDGYTEQVESNLNINKTAVLEDNGTYTITLDTYTKDNPITTLIQQNTPLDIVLVLDQSGSLAANDHEYLNELKSAVSNFVEAVANHGRHNEVDHRIAMVGYAGNAEDGHSSGDIVATGGKETDSWINTGVFDSNGEFHLYNYKGFTYEQLEDESAISAGGLYYTKVTTDGKDHYLLLTYHDEYRHLITEEQARVASLQGETVYGYVFNEQDVGSFEKLTRNSSGLWLYGDKLLYSGDRFFTYHTDVWTHRDGLKPREIHAYGVGDNYRPIDGHEGVYIRTEVENVGQQSIYKDALVPVTLGAGGSGGTHPGLEKAVAAFGADGATRASYGMEMANKILEENPIDPAEGRLRLVVMFTDGEPGYLGFDSSSGDSYYQQAVDEANSAISKAYISKNTHDAYVYTIGLYESAGVDATSEVAYYMNALSSNYPNAQDMDDIKADVTYVTPADGTQLQANGKFFYRYNNTYYEIKYGNVRVSGSYSSSYRWYYTRGNTNYSISTATQPVITDGKVNGNTIYQKQGGYAATEYSGYYSTTESATQLKAYFENILKDITTKITTEIVLHRDTILRDIMNQGLVLTDGTVITAYLQEGNYNAETGGIDWAVDEAGAPILDERVSLTVGQQFSAKDDESGVEILVYNYDAANATDPNGGEYHPHTVDITGYNFHEWYINETKPKGYKMVVTITRVEARDDAEWGRATSTNNDVSGLWLPADANGNRELLLPFDQPTTIFVERAYVLDYGKEFTLSGWYFDDEDGKQATPLHLDCDIESGMNWFDPAQPNTANAVNGAYGNTKYGNVRLENGEVVYAPTTMSWGGFDQFYVFGNTWRKTVLAQDANENGNLWNKVTVIPANNVYYEDSFLTTEDTTRNGIEGFVFGEGWEMVGEGAGDNYEIPEHQETPPYGDVHGWTDSLQDDFTFTDGSAHGTGLDGQTIGATATFTFTGTGAEVYTRTNARSGMVVAILTDSESGQTVKSIAVDNLAVSGDYYHIPTVAFKNLPYGTYTVKLIATSADVAVEGVRYEYYIDGVRIYNPLGSDTNYQKDIVKDAYGLEVNAVFTEVRDILLDYGDFNVDMEDDTEGIMGAVFIDWIQPGQESGDDTAGIGVPTYEIGTFEAYGPKNEVYLSAGQAIVLKVQEGNHYYVGLKSLEGGEVTVNVSGIDQAEPTEIVLSHTTDMYYRVTPVGGYIVIQNGSEGEEILSVTNLRTTNLTAPVDGGGILPVAEQEVIEVMGAFTEYMLNRPAPEVIPAPEKIPTVEEQVEANRLLIEALFADVRLWLKTA